MSSQTYGREFIHAGRRTNPQCPERDVDGIARHSRWIMAPALTEHHRSLDPFSTMQLGLHVGHFATLGQPGAYACDGGWECAVASIGEREEGRSMSFKERFPKRQHRNA